MFKFSHEKVFKSVLKMGNDDGRRRCGTSSGALPHRIRYARMSFNVNNSMSIAGRSSGFTAAQPRRIFTRFPILF
jgi:hypothetical protein